VNPALDLEHFARRLRSERLRLTDTRQQQQAAGETVELDQQRIGRLSRMDALQQQAMARAEFHRSGRRLAAIEAALRRIDEGAFGHCGECDRAIATGRLEADPAATLCITCAEKAGA